MISACLTEKGLPRPIESLIADLFCLLRVYLNSRKSSLRVQAAVVSASEETVWARRHWISQLVLFSEGEKSVVSILLYLITLLWMRRDSTTLRLPHRARSALIETNNPTRTWVASSSSCRGHGSGITLSLFFFFFSFVGPFFLVSARSRLSFLLTSASRTPR